MRLATGLPTYLGDPVDPQLVLDWARLADEAGFAAVAVHDKPNHRTWDPLTALAAVAPLTTRVRLATAVLVLPPRQEVLVGKQAAVIDVISGGRVDLAVAPGLRPDDFEALGVPFAHRGARFERQLATLVAQFDGGSVGPRPVQQPHLPLWIGGYQEAALDRVARFGDAYLFGASGIAAMTERTPRIRAAAAAAGKPNLPVAGCAYFGFDSHPGAREEAEANLVAYYGKLHKPFDEMVHFGDADTIGEALERYGESGIDRLYLFPTIARIEQLQQVASDLLPRFA